MNHVGPMTKERAKYIALFPDTPLTVAEELYVSLCQKKIVKLRAKQTPHYPAYCSREDAITLIAIGIISFTELDQLELKLDLE